MPIPQAILQLINVFSNAASISSGVATVLKWLNDSTVEDLFKKCFVDAVKQSAPNLADVVDPEKIEVDRNTLNDLITSLNDFNITELALLDRDKKLVKVTTHFQKCIILPGHQLTTDELVRRLQPVIEKTFDNFFAYLPKNQEAAKEMMLKADSMLLEGQEHLSGQNQAILDRIQGLDVNVSDAVETAISKEYQSEIDDTRVLLETYRPKSALDQFQKLKERIWTDAPPIVKFRILTNMAAAQFALNNEQEAAKLFIEAFQYNSEDEKALSNRALAHLLLGETEIAVDYTKQTLEKNPANVNAHVVLILISSKKELT